MDATPISQFTVRIPMPLREALEACARAETRSLNGQAEHFLKWAVAEYCRQHPEFAARHKLLLDEIS